MKVSFVLGVYFGFGFLVQGDKGEPGLPGDQGGKGKKVLRFDSLGGLFEVIATN